MTNKVTMFEVPASDIQKAKAFYERVFDWKVELWGDDGAMACTTPMDNDYNPVEPRRYQWRLLQAQIQGRLPVDRRTNSLHRQDAEGYRGGRREGRHAETCRWRNGDSWRTSPIWKATSWHCGKKERRDTKKVRRSVR